MFSLSYLPKTALFTFFIFKGMPAEISNGNTSILLPLLALVVLVMVGLYVKARETSSKIHLNLIGTQPDIWAMTS